MIISDSVVFINKPYFDRPQTKFAKVMFLQVSVCPQGGRRACVAGGVHGSGGVHGRGVHGWGHVWQRVACMAGRVRGGGGVHGRGAFVVWGMRDRGACMAGGSMRDRYHEIRSISGRYASYWNAFLLILDKKGATDASDKAKLPKGFSVTEFHIFLFGIVALLVLG